MNNQEIKNINIFPANVNFSPQPSALILPPSAFSPLFEELVKILVTRCKKMNEVIEKK